MGSNCDGIMGFFSLASDYYTVIVIAKFPKQNYKSITLVLNTLHWSRKSHGGCEIVGQATLASLQLSVRTIFRG